MPRFFPAMAKVIKTFLGLTDTPADYTGQAGKMVQVNSTPDALEFVDFPRRSITFIIDGGGAAITAGEKGHLRVPFACEIERVTLLADKAGDIKIDIWKDTYANFPPDNTDTITGANEPEIVAGVKDEDSALAGWTKAISAGDILAFNVDSCATIERVTLALKVKKT